MRQLLAWQLWLLVYAMCVRDLIGIHYLVIFKCVSQLSHGAMRRCSRNLDNFLQLSLLCSCWQRILAIVCVNVRLVIGIWSFSSLTIQTQSYNLPLPHRFVSSVNCLCNSLWLRWALTLRAATEMLLQLLFTCCYSCCLHAATAAVYMLLLH